MLSKITYLMKKMTAFYVLLFCVPLLLTCQKELNDEKPTPAPVNPLPPDTYYAEFDINGQHQIYAGSSQAQFVKNADSMFTCKLTLAVAPGSYAERLQITITDLFAIRTAKQYFGDLPTGKPHVTITYSDAYAKQYASTVVKKGGNAQVILTENTDNYVKGTFSGNLLNADDLAKGDTTHMMTITGGKFFIQK